MGGGIVSHVRTARRIAHSAVDALAVLATVHGDRKIEIGGTLNIDRTCGAQGSSRSDDQAKCDICSRDGAPVDDCHIELEICRIFPRFSGSMDSAKSCHADQYRAKAKGKCHNGSVVTRTAPLR